MTVAQQAQYSKEDVIRLGDELYETHIRYMLRIG